jgi:hypothetical protein
MPEVGAEVVVREAAGGALPDVLEEIAERTDAEYNRLLAEETCPMGSSLASMSDLAIDQRLLIRPRVFVAAKGATEFIARAIAINSVPKPVCSIQRDGVKRMFAVTDPDPQQSESKPFHCPWRPRIQMPPTSLGSDLTSVRIEPGLGTQQSRGMFEVLLPQERLHINVQRLILHR